MVLVDKGKYTDRHKTWCLLIKENTLIDINNGPC